MVLGRMEVFSSSVPDVSVAVPSEIVLDLIASCRVLFTFTSAVKISLPELMAVLLFCIS